VCEVENRAVAGREAIEIGDAQRQAVDRAAFYFDIHRLRAGSLQGLVDQDTDDGDDQAVAELGVLPSRCDGRDAPDYDAFGAAGPFAKGNFGMLCLQRGAGQERGGAEQNANDTAARERETGLHTFAAVKFNAARVAPRPEL
jgi:hypothetical protein